MVETCQAVLGGVQQLQQAITSLQVQVCPELCGNEITFFQTSIGSQAEKLERAVEYRQVIKEDYKNYFLMIFQ